MSEKYTVHVVDDDAGLRNSLRFMLSNANRLVRTFESGTAFLAELAWLEPGPVLLDIRMKEMDGFEVLRELERRDCGFPVVVLTGHGDIPMAVRAMKCGAVDFLTKPFARRELLTALELADRRLEDSDARDEQREHSRARLEVLSEREFQVLNELARGFPNKTIACDLEISPRTVEVHRANVMRKLEVRSFPDALRIAFAAGMPFAPSVSSAPALQQNLPLDREDEPTDSLG